MNIKKRLFELADTKYQKFSSSLIPGETKLIGVRFPYLRKLAKEIAKNNPLDFLKTEPEFTEEKILQAMVMGLINPPVIYIEKFIPKITNWAVCDTFCGNLNVDFEFIKKYSKSKKEFEQRFFLVCALCHFVNEKYINEIFKILNNMEFNGYYSKMGAGWLISVCYIKFKEKTEKFLKETKIDNQTLNKGIRKIIESRQVSIEDKTNVRNFIRH